MARVRTFHFGRFAYENVDACIRTGRSNIKHHDRNDINFNSAACTEASSLRFGFIDERFRRKIKSHFREALCIYLRSSVRFIGFTFNRINGRILRFEFLLAHRFGFTRFALAVRYGFAHFLLIACGNGFVAHDQGTKRTRSFRQGKQAHFRRFLARFIARHAGAAMFRTARGSVTLIRDAFACRGNDGQAAAFVRRKFSGHATHRAFACHF